MQMELFEFLPEEEAKQYKPLPSTDWKWTMANDYPKETNGLKVFSCFACGGAVQWATSWQGAKYLVATRLTHE